VPMLSDTVSAVRTPLYILFAAVGAMLLIGCANLANLLVARALARGNELSVRAALGASRARLMIQSVSELLPMLALGGALGLLSAARAIDVLVPILPAEMPRVESVGLHLPAVAFTVAALVTIAIAVGIWPALEATRGGLSASLAQASLRLTTGRSRSRDILV